MKHRLFQKAHVLAEVRLFEGLSPTQLSEVTAVAQSVERESDSNFFSQGEEASSVFVVADGRVKVSQVTPEGDQVVVRYAGSGEMFGCVPLYGGKEYPATASAVTRSQAFAWDRIAMDHLMQRYPDIAIRALEVLGEELADLRARYQGLATERVERRIARALLRLVSQAGEKVAAGVLIDFPLSRQDLGELTGTTLHTVSRILSGWEQKGIIESGRRRITICRPQGLVCIAEDIDPEGTDWP